MNKVVIHPIKRLVLILFMGLLITACNQNNYPRLSEDAIILAFGDSLTFGYGADRNQSYPVILEELTQLTVINAGISGETTSEGIKRFQTEIDKHHPDLIVLLEGGNDILRNHNLATTKNNLAQMIELAQSLNIQVVLIGVPEKKLFSDSAELYSQLAETYQLVYEQDLLSELLKSPQYKSDGVHFNSQGYRKLAEGIKELLEDNEVIK